MQGRKKVFLWRALSALGISAIADALDFIGGPILTISPIGDIPNAIITCLLFVYEANEPMSPAKIKEHEPTAVKREAHKEEAKAKEQTQTLKKKRYD